MNTFPYDYCDDTADFLPITVCCRTQRGVQKTAEPDGNPADVDSLISMNFWCYPVEFISVLQTGFLEFLTTTQKNKKDEYLFPIIADGMLKEGTEFSVLPTDDHWFGVTYKEDKPTVENYL